MRWILLLAGLLSLALLPARAGHKPPQIIMRIYVQTAGEGLPETEAHEVSVPPNGENIQIRALPEVTEQELINVQTDAVGNAHFQFDEEGQVALDTVTGQNQGRILVVMINGYIVYAPIIDEQISNGELIVPHPLKPEVIQMLEETAQRNVKQTKHA